jgi:hypothetical protein
MDALPWQSRASVKGISLYIFGACVVTALSLIHRAFTFPARPLNAVSRGVDKTAVSSLVITRAFSGVRYDY